MKKIVIIGASGHGGMILDCIKKEGQYSAIGFIDSNKNQGQTYSSLPILGNAFDIPDLILKHDLFGAIIAIGNNYTRKKMMERVVTVSRELNFVTVIHPNAVLSDDVKIGKGTIIMPGAIVNANSVIGDFCIVNTNSSLGHDGKMGDFSSISSGVCTGGNLVLGEFSALSLGANVIENITIGKHSVIGAGSLVVKNVEENTVVYGSPARFIRRRAVDEPYLHGDKIAHQSDKLN